MGTTWKGVEWKRRGPWTGHTGLKEEEETAVELESELPSPTCGLLILKAVAGICLELLRKSHETVLEHPDDSWCGAGASDAMVSRRVSVSVCSPSLFLPPVLSCRGRLFVYSAADTLLYSNTSSITHTHKKPPPKNLASCL